MFTAFLKKITTRCCILITLTMPFLYSKKSERKTVIISFNVLFRPNESIIEHHVRKSLGTMRSIGLLFSGIPSKAQVKEKLFGELAKISLANIAISPDTWKTDYTPWDIDYPYPPILNQLVTSSTQRQEEKIYQKVVNALQEQLNLSKSYRIILKSVADFLFQSTWMNKVMEPVPEMVQLLEKLKKHNVPVFLIGAVPGHAWDTFLSSYPQSHSIKNYFAPENIYISGKTNLLPTSPEAYALLLRDHNLDPKNCIVMTHNPHDLAHPKELGMKTFVYDPRKNTPGFLKVVLNQILDA